MNLRNATHEPKAKGATASDDLRTISTRVCHDLFSPTNTLRMCLTMLGDDPEDGALNRRDLLETANGAVDELITVVERVRFVTEASTGSSRREAVDMESCFAQAVQSLGAEGRKRAGQIEAPSEWPMVAGVGLWIREILSIYLKNAFQHGGPDVQVEVNWEKRGERFRFNVVDDGAGVPDSLRHSLFRPFEELHRFNDGRGLSLSVVERLTKLQRGSCGYEPAPGGGSLFFVELPNGADADDALESE